MDRVPAPVQMEWVLVDRQCGPREPARSAAPVAQAINIIGEFNPAGKFNADTTAKNQSMHRTRRNYPTRRRAISAGITSRRKKSAPARWIEYSFPATEKSQFQP